MTAPWAETLNPDQRHELASRLQRALISFHEASRIPGKGRRSLIMLAETANEMATLCHDVMQVGSPGHDLCGRCKAAPVHKPGAVRADGRPRDTALYCWACIDRCHEATDFAHICVICASPEEARMHGWTVTP